MKDMYYIYFTLLGYEGRGYYYYEISLLISKRACIYIILKDSPFLYPTSAWVELVELSSVMVIHLLTDIP